jgi:hypothetical protein
MKNRTSVRQTLVGLALLAMLFLASGAISIHTHAASGYPPLPSVSSTTPDGVYISYPATSVMDSQNVLAPVDSQIYGVHEFSPSNKMVNVSFTVTTVPSSSPSMTPQVMESDDGGQTFYQVYAQDGSTFAAITSAGSVAGKDFPIHGDLIKIHYANQTGSGANFQFTATAAQAQ